MLNKYVIFLQEITKWIDKGSPVYTDMTVSEQCGIAASKGNQILGLIRRHLTYKVKH